MTLSLLNSFLRFVQSFVTLDLFRKSFTDGTAQFCYNPSLILLQIRTYFVDSRELIYEIVPKIQLAV